MSRCAGAETRGGLGQDTQRHQFHYCVQPEMTVGSDKAGGLAQVVPLAEGQTIGKLALAAATRRAGAWSATGPTTAPT
ncbi:MAG: hypothetical protein MUC88_04475 [Planctomycetes bacterium]|nr:hypothetical protein [Planctomycetota bacterium]